MKYLIRNTLIFLCVCMPFVGCVEATPNADNATPNNTDTSSFGLISVRAQAGGNDQSTVVVEFGSLTNTALVRSTGSANNPVAIRAIDASKFTIRKTMKNGKIVTLKRRGSFIRQQYVYITVADTITTDDSIEVTVSPGAVESSTGKKNTARRKSAKATRKAPKLLDTVSIAQSTDIYLIYDGLVSAASESEFTVSVGGVEKKVMSTEIVRDVTQRMQKAFIQAGYAQNNVNTEGIGQYIVRITLAHSVPKKTSITITASNGAVTSIDGKTKSDRFAGPPVKPLEDADSELETFDVLANDGHTIMLTMPDSVSFMPSYKTNFMIVKTGPDETTVATTGEKNEILGYWRQDKNIYITLADQLIVDQYVYLAFRPALLTTMKTQNIRTTYIAKVVQKSPELVDAIVQRSNAQAIFLYFSEKIQLNAFNANNYTITTATNKDQVVSGTNNNVTSVKEAITVEIPEARKYAVNVYRTDSAVKGYSYVIKLSLTNSISNNTYVSVILADGIVTDTASTPNNSTAVPRTKPKIISPYKNTLVAFVANPLVGTLPRVGSRDIIRLKLNQVVNVSYVKNNKTFGLYKKSSPTRIIGKLNGAVENQEVWPITIAASKLLWENVEYIVKVGDGDETKGQVYTFTPRAGDETTAVRNFVLTTSAATTHANKAAEAGLLVDYENNDITPNIPNIIANLPRALDASTIGTIARTGKYSLRTKIFTSPDYASSSQQQPTVRRSEISMLHDLWYTRLDLLSSTNPPKPELRIAFSFYLPSNWESESEYTYDDIIFQAKRHNSAGPDIGLAVRGNKGKNELVLLSFRNNWAGKGDITNPIVKDTLDVMMDDITRGEWYDFVFDVQWSTSTDGYLHIFWKKASDTAYTVYAKNTGITMNKKFDTKPTTSKGYIKWGNYRPNGGRSTIKTPHVFYHDDIRVINFYRNTHFYAANASNQDQLLEMQKKNVVNGTVIATAKTDDITLASGTTKPASFTFKLLHDSSFGGLGINETTGEIQIVNSSKLTQSSLYPRFHFDVSVRDGSGDDAIHLTKTFGLKIIE